MTVNLSYTLPIDESNRITCNDTSALVWVPPCDTRYFMAMLGREMGPGFILAEINESRQA